MLKYRFTESLIEAGVDEAGRGCLAGPVVAAAVILPEGLDLYGLTDSKQMPEKDRLFWAEFIKRHAISFAIASASPAEIDKINILQASLLAMHRALEGLVPQPEFILVDGNKFKPYAFTPYQTVVKGDSKFYSIAAASVLAKTTRDAIMEELHLAHPAFNWKENKGYPTPLHKKMLTEVGLTPYHRLSYGPCKNLIS